MNFTLERHSNCVGTDGIGETIEAMARKRIQPARPSNIPLVLRHGRSRPSAAREAERDLTRLKSLAHVITEFDLR